jgi:hypothetical protein
MCVLMMGIVGSVSRMTGVLMLSVVLPMVLMGLMLKWFGHVELHAKALVTSSIHQML